MSKAFTERRLGLSAVLLVGLVSILLYVAGRATPDTRPTPSGRWEDLPPANSRSGISGGSAAGVEDQVPPSREVMVSDAIASDATLQVTVKWVGDLLPVEGLSVTLTCLGGRVASVETRRTDAMGHARFDGCEPGSAIVLLDRRRDSESLILRAGENHLSTFVDPSALLKGKVVDDNGLPVADAGIWLSHHQDWSSASEICRSSADGSFLVRGVTGPRFVFARSEARAASWPQKVDPSIEDLIEIRLIHPGHAVSGRVLAADSGQPIANSHLRLEPPVNLSPPIGADGMKGAPLFPWSATTDANGEFMFHGIPAGRGVLRIRASGYASRAIPYRSSENDHPMDVMLERGAIVAGLVLAHDGQPVGDALVVLGPETPVYPGGSTFDPFACARVLTDGEGRFRFEHAPMMQLPLLASARFVATRSFIDPSREATESCRLVLPPTGSSRSTITLAMTDGTPIRGGRIDVAGASPTSSWGLRGTTDEDGIAVIEGIPSGALRVMATLPSVSSHPVACRFVEESSRQTIAIRVDPHRLQTGDVRIQVVSDSDGRLLEGIPVSLSSESLSPRRISSRTDRLGVARFVDLPGDVYSMMIVTGPDASIQLDDIRVEDSRLTDLGQVRVSVASELSESVRGR